MRAEAGKTVAGGAVSPAELGSVARRLSAADYIAAGYNAVLAAIWGALLTRASYAPLLFAAHAAAVAMPWLISRASTELSLVGRWTREVYPLIWVLPLWIELDFLRELLHGTAHDVPIVALDRAIFRVNIDSIWIWRMPAVWFSELMHLSYFSYYPAVVLPLLYVGFAGRSTMLRDVTFRVTLTYFSCYLIYIVFPVDGPHFLAPQYQGTLNEGLFYQLVRSFQGPGDSMGCSFPSSHVAGVVTMAYLGWRWFSRGAFALLAAAAVGVSVSCVYTQNHYAIDAVAGIALALGLQLLVAPVLLRRLGTGPAPVAKRYN